MHILNRMITVLTIFLSIGCIHPGINVQAHPSQQLTTKPSAELGNEHDWRTEFEPGYVYCVGRGQYPNHNVQADQAKFQARRAAIDNGYANLLLELKRVHEQNTHDRSCPASVKSAYKDELQYAEIVQERPLKNGLYQVLMRAPYFLDERSDEGEK